jgi:hypothetical protein
MFNPFLIIFSDTWEFAAILAAISSTTLIRRSDPTARLTSPMRSASLPSIDSPVNSSSRALPGPIRSCTSRVAPPVTDEVTFASGEPICASEAAMRMSQARASS